MILNTKEAVRLAKEWLAGQMSDEGISEIGLEEVRWKEGAWEITLGFARPWDTDVNLAFQVAAGLAARKRTYKVLVVDDEKGSVVEMRNREAA